MQSHTNPFLAAMLLTAVLPAQSLVTDIRPGSGSSNPTNLVAMGGVAYFFAETAAAGIELWRSDGTPVGTWMVKDINPAPGAGAFPPVRSPELVVLGSQLVFWASDGTNGAELWHSDGTAVGTAMLTDANPGLGDSLPQDLTVAGSRVFYFATTPVVGKELWITDGTAAGTGLVVDFSPTPNSSGAGDRNNVGQGAGQLAAVGENVYFLGSNSPLVTPTLCFSDGTATGTGVVSTAATYADRIMPFGNGVVFAAYNPATGIEPWISDTTLGGPGTVMLRDVEPGAASSVNSRFVVFGGRIHFIANTTAEGYSHWVSDGTPPGTQLLYSPFLADPFARVRALRSAGDRLYLQVSTLLFGNELYSTDGVAVPTRVVDLNPGANDGFGGVGSWLAVGTGRVAVTALQSSNAGGYELGVTDGTAAGTHVLVDLATNNGNSSQPREFTRVGEKIFFAAADNGQTGRELYAMPVGPLGAAEVESYGVGCAGTGGLVPRVAALSAPQLGNAAFGEQLDRGLPGVASALCVSFLAAALPAGSCTILVTPGTITFYGVTDPQGRFTVPIALPNDAGLLGLQWFTQGVVLDPAGLLFGVASASNGLRVRLGH